MKKLLWILAGLLALPTLAYLACVVILLWNGSTLSEALIAPIFLAFMFILELIGR